MKTKIMVVLMMVMVASAFAMDERALWSAGGSNISHFGIVGEDDITVYVFGNGQDGIWHKGFIFIFTKESVLTTEVETKWYTHHGNLVLQLVKITSYDAEGNVLGAETSGQVFRSPASLRYVEGEIILIIDGKAHVLIK